MITIQEGVWREDCVAAIDFDAEEKEVLVLPLNCVEWITYSFETVEQAMDAYKTAVAQFASYLRGKK